VENFIRVTNEQMANKLENEGFELVSEGSGEWLFLNDPAVKKFNKNEAKKMMFTNKVWG
jgi:hypothetical protein